MQRSLLGTDGVPLLFLADEMVIFGFPASDRYSGKDIPSFLLSDDGNMPRRIQIANEHGSSIWAKRSIYMKAFLYRFNSNIDSTDDITHPSSLVYYIDAWLQGAAWILRENNQCNLHWLPVFFTVDSNSPSGCCVMFRTLAKDVSDTELCLDIMELYYRIACQKSNHEPQTALILVWSLIERCQNILWDILWDIFMKNGYKSIAPNADIKGKRIEVLLFQRRYTAAIQTQILGLSDTCSDTDVESLDQARKKRNDFMHSMQEIVNVDAFGAQLAAANLKIKTFDVELRPFGSWSGWEFT